MVSEAKHTAELDKDVLEVAYNAALKRLKANVVYPEKLTEQEAAILFNFQECLQDAVKYYIQNTRSNAALESGAVGELVKALELARHQMQQSGVVFTHYVTSTIDIALAKAKPQEATHAKT